MRLRVGPPRLLGLLGDQPPRLLGALAHHRGGREVPALLVLAAGLRGRAGLFGGEDRPAREAERGRAPEVRARVVTMRPSRLSGRFALLRPCRVCALCAEPPSDVHLCACASGLPCERGALNPPSEGPARPVRAPSRRSLRFPTLRVRPR